MPLVAASHTHDLVTAQHKEQVASVLRRAVQEVLARGLNDPRVRGLVSVTNIKLSDDLANATLLVSILPEEHEKITLQGLRAAAGHIRSETSKQVRMRRVPRLTFEIDGPYKRQQAVLAAISRAVGPAEGGESPESSGGPDANDSPPDR